MRYHEIDKNNIVATELPEAYEFLKSVTNDKYYPMHEVEFMHKDKSGRGFIETNIPFSKLYQEEHIKICSCCGEYMANGYVVNEDYYCSDECFDSVYGAEERESIQPNDPDVYYTEWQDIPTDYNGKTLQQFIAESKLGDEWQNATEKYIRTK